MQKLKDHRTLPQKFYTLSDGKAKKEGRYGSAKTTNDLLQSHARAGKAEEVDVIAHLATKKLRSKIESEAKSKWQFKSEIPASQVKGETPVNATRIDIEESKDAK
jgi:hypothetical protein